MCEDKFGTEQFFCPAQPPQTRRSSLLSQPHRFRHQPWQQEKRLLGPSGQGGRFFFFPDWSKTGGFWGGGWPFLLFSPLEPEFKLRQEFRGRHLRGPSGTFGGSSLYRTDCGGSEKSRGPSGEHLLVWMKRIAFTQDRFSSTLGGPSGTFGDLRGAMAPNGITATLLSETPQTLRKTSSTAKTPAAW